LPLATNNILRPVPLGPRHIYTISITDVLKLVQSANQIGAIFYHSICKYGIVGKIENVTSYIASADNVHTKYFHWLACKAKLSSNT